MTEVTSYVREECIPKFISPLGHRYAVFQMTENPQLWEVRPVSEDDIGNEKADYRRSQPIEGTFTGRHKAVAALLQWLTLMWDKSDNAKMESAKPLAKKAA